MPLPAISTTTSTLLLGTLTTLGGLKLYLRHLHERLRSQVQSGAILAATPREAASSNDLESLPQDLLDNAEEYRVYHSQDSLPLPRHVHFTSTIRSHDVNQDQDQQHTASLFTRLLQRNMSLFSTYTPQAYLLRLLAQTPEQKRSFRKAYIASLPFKPGDLVCGFYRVLVLRALQCEMVITAPGFSESFGGRLILSLVPFPDTGTNGVEEHSQCKKEGLILRTETLQWVRKSEGMGLPLEGGLVRWMHEVASWGLLVSGARWLEEEVGAPPLGK